MPSFHDIDLAQDQFDALTAIELACREPIISKTNRQDINEWFQAEAG